MSEPSLSDRLRLHWLAEAEAQRHPRWPLFCRLWEEEVALILEAGAILRAPPGEIVMRATISF